MTDSVGADVAQVQLGTPPANFQILMDSGSADFWVGSEHCRSQAGGGQYNQVDTRAA